MFLTTTIDGVTFKETYFLRWYRQGTDTLRIVVVGSTGDIERLLTYKSILIKNQRLSFTAVQKFEKMLENALSQFKEVNQGAFDFDKLPSMYNLTSKRVESTLGKNLVQLYGRASKINGYYSDWNTVMAVSGHAITEQSIRLFVGDLLSARVDYGMDIDVYIVDKLERASFGKHLSHMDLVSSAFYINDMQKRNTDAYKDKVKEVKLDITLEEWLSVLPDKKEMKKAKKKKGLFSRK